MKQLLVGLLSATLAGATVASQTTATTTGALIARAKSLELNTPYVPPPGDPLEHHASGFAKIICSAVFITGLDPDFAAESVGYFTAPYAIRSRLGKPVIDPVLINYLIRLGIEKRGEQYLSFPQRALFDKLGIRTMVIETDPFGNFLAQGYELASARDWARLGNLYLQDGVWNGQRILPEGYVKFVSTLAPAWEADKRPVYGAFFWINGDGALPVPKEAYYMSGAGGQTTLIVPSHELVVVRMGHFRGEAAGGESFRKALALLMEAVPRRN